jgi:hypothetical protein
MLHYLLFCCIGAMFCYCSTTIPIGVMLCTTSPIVVMRAFKRYAGRKFKDIPIHESASSPDLPHEKSRVRDTYIRHFNVQVVGALCCIFVYSYTSILMADTTI